MASSFDDRLLSAGGEMTMTRPSVDTSTVEPASKPVASRSSLSSTSATLFPVRVSFFTMYVLYRQPFVHATPHQPGSARAAVEGRALPRRDRYHLAALLRLDAGIGRHRRCVRVPGERPGRTLAAQDAEEAPQLHAEDFDEALLPVDQ